MMNKDEFDIVLNYADELYNLPILSKVLRDRLTSINIQKTNEFGAHIPMTYRIQKYNFASQVGKLFFEKLEKLIEKGIVKKIYRYIGFVESSEDITVICCALLEDKYKDLSEEFLYEILHNDDPNYKYE